MVNTAYTIHCDGPPNFAAEYNTADPNTITRGQTATFEFETELATATGDLVVQGGYTYTIPGGTTEEYDDVVIENNGTLVVESNATLNCNTLTNSGTLTDNGTVTVQEGLVATGSVLDYFEYAGSYTTLETLDSTVKFRSQLPSTLAINSLVVGIEPATSLQDKNVRGIWGLVEGVSDERLRALTTDRYAWDVRVLAQYEDYQDVTAVKNDLQI